MLGTNDCKSWYGNTSTAIAEGADKLKDGMIITPKE